tara:strand:+ start:4354 stop:4980 length:627 start_codon:yes stop_codon:yes gene_type:complete
MATPSPIKSVIKIPLVHSTIQSLNVHLRIKLLDLARSLKHGRTRKLSKSGLVVGGFPLDENGLGGKLEKSIILTNWANTQGHKMGIETKISSKLLSDEQVDNFLLHIDSFRPRVLLLMGSQLIHCLNNQKVISRFEAIVGKRISVAKSIQQDMEEGRRFKVYFQEFQKNAGAHCQVVCFPHPSGSIGLRDGYIAQYKNLMSPIISQFS